MKKKKTSINVDPDLWNQWLHFVLDETGSVKKVSEEFEKALKSYMNSRRKPR